MKGETYGHGENHRNGRPADMSSGALAQAALHVDFPHAALTAIELATSVA